MYNILDPEPFLPLNAFLQVNGDIEVGDDAVLQYAVHFGNNGTVQYGTFDDPSGGGDTTTGIGIGGRIGVVVSDLKVGVSATMDEQPFGVITAARPPIPGVSTTAVVRTTDLGDVGRMRLGADLSYSIAGFTLLGEMIMVSYSLDADQEATLEDMAAATSIPGMAFFRASQNKMTYFASLMYDVSEEFYVAGMYSSWKDESNVALSDGITSMTGVVGWRPTDAVVVKASYIRYEIVEPDDFPIQWGLSLFNIAGSIVF